MGAGVTGGAADRAGDSGRREHRAAGAGVPAAACTAQHAGKGQTRHGAAADQGAERGRQGDPPDAARCGGRLMRPRPVRRSTYIALNVECLAGERRGRRAGGRPNVRSAVRRDVPPWLPPVRTRGRRRPRGVGCILHAEEDR